MADASIYDQLAKESFSDLTITQLNAGTSVTAVDQATINYWKGPLTLSRVLEASRTYAGGTLPIPETGAIVAIPVSAGDDVGLQPAGSELWAIKAIFAIASGGNATGQISLTDGSVIVPFNTGITITTSGTIIDLNDVGSPPIISNSLYLNFAETGSTNPINFFVAYFKMGL